MEKSLRRIVNRFLRSRLLRSLSVEMTIKSKNGGLRAHPTNCSLLFIVPPFLLFSDFFDFFEAIESAFVYATAFYRCCVPIVGRGKVFRPERPDPALVWPDRIDYAALFTSYSVQEDAVFCYRLFFN